MTQSPEVPVIDRLTPTSTRRRLVQRLIQGLAATVGAIALAPLRSDVSASPACTNCSQICQLYAELARQRPRTKRLDARTKQQRQWCQMCLDGYCNTPSPSEVSRRQHRR